MHFNSKHGHSKSPTYKSWSMAKARCYNKNWRRFDRYGGRGIKMCSEWANSFEAFLADMGERPNGKTLDRIDNDGDYCPDNCVWSTPEEQSSNRTGIVQFHHNGVKMSMSRYCREVGVSVNSVVSRVMRNPGMSHAEAIEHFLSRKKDRRSRSTLQSSG